MKQRSLIILFVAILSLVYFAADAQNFVINGEVTDFDTGEALIGATILQKGTTTGTITDFDGKFSIENAQPGDTLVFSYTGYQEESLVIRDESFIQIALRLNSQMIEEVVVIGYGKQKKKVATGSIAKITTENIEGIVTSDVQSTLEGQVSGLIVNESSGQPGAGKSILIRGVSTNGDNSPLYIVDGVQVGGIGNISPGDIESIDVLKDAASSAIYGARAANGVVIITTKKGAGDGTGMISYEGSYSTSNPWRLPEMLNASDYIMLTREKYANSNQTSALDALGFPQVGDTPAFNTNWMDQIFNPATINSHRLSASTKNAFMSMEYWDQKGVIGGDKSKFTRYALRLNSTKDINEYVTVGENLYVSRNENRNIGDNNAFGSVLIDAFAYDPITDVYNDDKQYGFEQSKWVQKEYINPLSRLFLSNSTGVGDNVLGNVYVEISPIEGLSFRSDAGIDIGWWNWRSFTPDYEFHSAAVNVTNDVSQGYGVSNAWQWENYAKYDKSFGNGHNLNFVAGTSYKRYYQETAGGSTSNIPDAVKFNPNWQWIDAGPDSLDLAFGSRNVEYHLISYFARGQYNLQDKYLFTATVRRDGSSNFGENNRWGVFPSFSAGWVLSEEEFFNFEPISFLKFKASWGRNGSDRIAALAYASTIERVFTYAFGQDQSLYTGSALATPPNPNVKWEESEQIDIGVEMELFEGKWNLEADVYQKNTKDLLMSEVIPGYIGATNNPTSNLGEIRNRGVEVSLGNRARIGELTINTRLTYTHFTNTVIDVAGEAGYIQGWGWPVRNTSITRMTEGYPVGHFVGYKSDGIFQSQAEVFGHINSEGNPLQPNAKPGDIRFKDINEDGVINTDDITDLGSPWPDHVFGLSLNMNYKGFDFSAIFGTQLGHDIYRTYERSDVSYTNYQSFWLDRWTEENPSETMPRLVSVDVNNNQRPSDFYIEDASFLRLKNLQIGYTLPKDVVSLFKAREMRIYFSSNNLFTVTNYRGFDPEIGTAGWILDTGIDKGFYPSNKSFGGGVKISF
jgi:TonB-linked SusC/RagA family outer membrane protein